MQELTVEQMIAGNQKLLDDLKTKTIPAYYDGGSGVSCLVGQARFRLQVEMSHEDWERAERGAAFTTAHIAPGRRYISYTASFVAACYEADHNRVESLFSDCMWPPYNDDFGLALDLAERILLAPYN